MCEHPVLNINPQALLAIKLLDVFCVMNVVLYILFLF